MKNNFDIMFNHLLKHEGGYNDIKEDKGGATNYGISLRFLKTINKDANKDTIKNLTKDDAKKLYFTHFYSINNFDMINNQKVANKLFDMCVNMGNNKAIKILQECLNVKVDGFCGVNTINAINFIDGGKLIDLLVCRQREFYNEIVRNNLTQMIFLNGWLKRAEYRG